MGTLKQVIYAVLSPQLQTRKQESTDIDYVTSSYPMGNNFIQKTQKVLGHDKNPLYFLSQVIVFQIDELLLRLKTKKQFCLQSLFPLRLQLTRDTKMSIREEKTQASLY